MEVRHRLEFAESFFMVLFPLIKDVLNSHTVQFASYDNTCKNMGNLLVDQLSNGYYAIATDFYKTMCILLKGCDGARTNQVFYSCGQLTKATKQFGFDAC